MSFCCKCFGAGKNQVEPTNIDVTQASKLLLTDDERKLIISTWKKINYDFTSRGIRVFELILRNPELKELFPFKHLSGEALKQNALFRAHSSRFVQSVAAVVEELESSSGRRHDGRDPLANMSDWKIGQLLNALGQSHASIRNLTPELFKDQGKKAALEALLAVWQEDLGHYWTEDVAKAWARLFDAIITEMYSGLESTTASRRIETMAHRQSVASGGSRRLRLITDRLGSAIDTVLTRIGGRNPTRANSHRLNST